MYLNLNAAVEFRRKEKRQKKDKPGSNSSQSLTIHLSWTTKSMYCDIKDYCTCPDLMSYYNKQTIDNRKRPRAFRAIRFCSICSWEFSYDFLKEKLLKIYVWYATLWQFNTGDVGAVQQSKWLHTQKIQHRSLKSWRFLIQPLCVAEGWDKPERLNQCQI